jgi:hypothetical protein
MISAPYFNWLYAKENGFVAWLFLGQVVPTGQAFIGPYYTAKHFTTKDWTEEDKTNLVHFKRSMVAAYKAAIMLEGVAKKGNIGPADVDRTIDLMKEAVNESKQVRDDVLTKIHPDCPRAYREYYLTPAVRMLAMFQSVQSGQFDEGEFAAIGRIAEGWNKWADEHKHDMRFPKDLPE